MAWNIYPTNTPVGSWQGQSCEEIQEFQHAEWLNLLHQSTLHSFRCSGGVFTKGAGDSLDIPSGTYIIDGRVVYIDAADNLVITSARPTFLFARLLKTGDLVTSGEYYSNTDGSEPADPNVRIGRIDTVQGVANTISVCPVTPVVVSDSFTWDPDYAISIYLGFAPSQVALSFKGYESVWMECGSTYVYPLNGGVEITIENYGFEITAMPVLTSGTMNYTAWV